MFLGYNDEASTERGFFRPEDAPVKESSRAKGSEAGTDGEASGVAAEISELPSLLSALIEDLTTRKTAALGIELANNPHVAFVAVVHTLLLGTGYGYTGGAVSALQVRATASHLQGADEGNAAPEVIKRALGLPVNPARLWSGCLEQPQERLLALLAFGAGRSINCIRKPHDDRSNAYAHGDLLGRALDFDMTRHFKPTATNYFGRISRVAIEDAVREARGEDAAAQVRAAGKKAEAAAMAERLVAGSGWLPAHLRFAEPAAITNDDEFVDDDLSDEGA